MLVQKVLTSERIAKTVYRLLEMNPYANTTDEQTNFLRGCMIAMTGCEAIDEGLNEMKAVLMAVVRNLLSFTFEKRPKIKVEGNYFF